MVSTYAITFNHAVVVDGYFTILPHGVCILHSRFSPYLNITDCMVDLWFLSNKCFYTVHTYMNIQCIFHQLYNCIICFGRCTLYMPTKGIWLDLVTSSMTAQFGVVVLLPVVMSCRIVCRTQAQVPAPYEVWWGHNYDKLYTCVCL